MADLSYNIPTEKVGEYVEDYVFLHPNTEKDEEGNAKYTDVQWVREHILRYIQNQITRGKISRYQANMESYKADDVS